MVFIYGLVCPIEEVIRYIGKSVSPEKRFIAHLSGARRMSYDHHTARWIRKLDSEGLKPSLVILQELTTDQDWRSAERGWISKAVTCGWPLTNSTAGGEGLDYIDPEAEAQYRKNHRSAMKRLASTDEGKAGLKKMQEASVSPEVLARKSNTMKKVWADPAKKASLAVLLQKLATDPEILEKKSASAKIRWAKNKQEIISQMWTIESREKHRASRIAAWADPVVGEKLRAIHSSDEVRAKKSAKAKERSTPEYRAMMAEKTRKSWEARRAKANMESV